MLDRCARRAAANHTLIFSGSNERQSALSFSPRIPSATRSISSSPGNTCEVLPRHKRARLSGNGARRASNSSQGNIPIQHASNSRSGQRASSPLIKSLQCCQVLEKDGGMFGCVLPAGHKGAHQIGALDVTRHRRMQEQELEQRPAQPRNSRSHNADQQTARCQKATGLKMAKEGKICVPRERTVQARDSCAAATPSLGAPPSNAPAALHEPLPRALQLPRQAVAPAAGACVQNSDPRHSMDAAQAWLLLEETDDESEIALAYDVIERESARLAAMSYEEILVDRASFLAQVPEHPAGIPWGDDWSAGVRKALLNMPVRKRHAVGGRSLTTLGKVVGCIDRFFQIVYESTHFEARSWPDLRMLLVPHDRLEDALAAAIAHDNGSLSRTSRRPPKKRDLDEESEQYLPRLGCHYSLPPGKVACYLHESLRLAAVVPYDPGPAASD